MYKQDPLRVRDTCTSSMYVCVRDCASVCVSEVSVYECRCAHVRTGLCMCRYTGPLRVVTSLVSSLFISSIDIDGVCSLLLSVPYPIRDVNTRSAVH